MSDTTATREELLAEARERYWYHCLELEPGFVTDGQFDLRPYVREYDIPDDLTGKRCLDVGTWDGFWAFELERRGAEVVGLDVDDQSTLDWPPRRRPNPEFFKREGVRGGGFRLARDVLGSRVERVNCNIYDATPERLGTFDLVFCGSVLMHVRDQLLALERLAGVCSDRMICAVEYDRRSGLTPWSSSRYLADRDKSVVFWLPSVRTWKRMTWTAGFDRVEATRKFKMASTDGYSVPHVVLHAHKR